MLIEEYPSIMAAAKKLLGSADFENEKEGIEKSYCVCKTAWERNLKRIEGLPIKYLLICEASPKPTNGQVSYFYETFDNSIHGRPVGWIRSILYLFNGRKPPVSIEHSLNIIASNQMLLIDSLPVAMKYTSNIRKKANYRNLIVQSREYLMDVLNHPLITWAPNVQIAFGFKLNAKVLVDVYRYGIELPNGQKLNFSESQIITDGSGYPSAAKLQALWGL